jgi:hypothetical protein
MKLAAAIAALAAGLLLAACGGDEKTVTQQTTVTVTQTQTTKAGTTATNPPPQKVDCVPAPNPPNGLVELKSVGYSCKAASDVASEFADQCGQSEGPCSLDAGFECTTEQFPQADSARVTCVGELGRVEIGFAG